MKILGQTDGSHVDSGQYNSRFLDHIFTCNNRCLKQYKKGAHGAPFIIKWSIIGKVRLRLTGLS